MLTTLDGLLVTKPLYTISKLDPKHPNLQITCPNNDLINLQPIKSVNYNFRCANYEVITSILKEIDWYTEFEKCNTIDDMTSVFYDIINTAIDKNVPKHTTKPNDSPPWFNKSLRKLLAEKNKLRIKYRKYNNPRDKIEFNILRDRCHKLCKKLQSQYIKGIETGIAKNPKVFWRYIKDKRNNRSFLPAVMHMGDKVANTGADIANLFATTFSSVYTSPRSTSYSHNNYYLNNANQQNNIGSLSFNEKDIINKIKKIDTYKGSGPDGIPPLFVKQCATALVLPLSIIFNHSLKKGTFPYEWKKARIAPLHKKGDPTDVKNYRPISILSCFSKLFESLICPVITQYTDHIITVHQHGFKKGRSVETNLITFVSELIQEVDKGAQIDAIYTDFSSAFDKVDHNILLNRLENIGLHGSILLWFKSYLNNRPQTIHINGHESHSYIALSGVPQGSILAPILFSIFINDITSHIKHCKFSFFADDLKIYKSVNSISDINAIQHDIDAIRDWCNHNGMVLNSQKCHHIKYTKKKIPIASNYHLEGTALHETSEIRDLGVIIDSKLTFVPHINTIVKKSAQMLGFIKRNTKNFRLSHSKILLYNSLVRSHLEFASSVWNPIYSVHSQRIESLQRSFTRSLAFSSQNISHRELYDNRLIFFKMNSLRTRRKVHDLMLLHKILHGYMDCSQLLERVTIGIPYHYPRKPITKIFNCPFSKTNLGRNTPISKICQEYNRINQISGDLDIFHDAPSIYRNKILCHLGGSKDI